MSSDPHTSPAERTAREHRQRAARIACFRDPDERDLARLEDLLVVSALEHDSPFALLRTAALELRELQLLRPALSTLERLVVAARARAERETHERLAPVLDAETRRALDALCVTDVRLGVSRLVWLGREAPTCAPADSSPNNRRKASGGLLQHGAAVSTCAPVRLA